MEFEEFASLPVFHNLPPQPTPLIGRTEALNLLQKILVDDRARLVTILGPGGMGKTRLAVAAAEQMLETAPDSVDAFFPHGIFFISLASFSSAAHIVPATAVALDFRLVSGIHQEESSAAVRTAQQQLLDFLHNKKMLLIMDNFEHLLADTQATALIAEILAQAPAVQILVTSRTRLQLRQEQLFPLHGLDCPEWDALATQSAYTHILDFTAVQLFQHSAQRLLPDFTIEPTDAPYLAHICHLLDGLPLAIELAASWVAVLTLPEIAAEVQRGLDFLASEVQDIEERHRSLRAVIDYSWQQLNQTERDAFVRLSVFRGDFTRAAAQAVAEVSLPLLSTLMNKSLLQFNQANGRYQMHQLLFQYAAEKLSQTAEMATAVRHKHSHYYGMFIGDLKADLKSAKQPQALNLIEADVENGRAAWEWAISNHQIDPCQQLLEPLCLFFLWRDRHQEGEAMCATAVAHVNHPQKLQEKYFLGRVIGWQGHFNHTLGLKKSDQLLKESLTQLKAVGTELDTRLDQAQMHLRLGSIDMEQGEREAAQTQYEQAQQLFQQHGDDWGLATTLSALGWLAWSLGDYPKARELYEESLILHQKTGDPKGIATTLMGLGRTALFQGNIEEAEHTMQECLKMRQSLADKGGMASSYGNLGTLKYIAGQFDEAKTLAGKSLAIRQELGDRLGIAHWTLVLAYIYLNLGDYQQARKLATNGRILAGAIEYQRGLMMAGGVIGGVALAEVDYASAEEALSQSVHIGRTIKQQEEMSLALAGLGYAAWGLGELDNAREYLAEALWTGAMMRAFQPIMFALPAIALLLADKGQIARSVELYAFATKFPMVTQSRWFADVAGQAMRSVADLLPAVEREEAEANGRARKLRKTVAELVQEISQPDFGEPEDFEASKTDSTALLAGRFVQEGLLTVGGMGELHHGRDLQTGEAVVIKRLRPELLIESSDIVARFQREIEALNALAHPNIVNLVTALEENGRPVIVMEYVPGGSLRDLLDTAPQLPIPQMVALGIALANALTCTHEKNIIHRDLKPANVLLAEDGSPRLTDFGIARFSHRVTRLTHTGILMGTILYMSPEACHGEQVDVRTDIWSLGVMFYEMLAGRPPFAHEKTTALLLAILDDPVPPISQFRPDLPGALVELVQGMLVKERNGRIAAMIEVEQTLRNIQPQIG